MVNGRRIFFYSESEMLLREKTESYNNNGGEYFRNRGVKMEVLYQYIYDGIIQEKIDSYDHHVAYQLHAATQVGVVKHNVFRQQKAQWKGDTKGKTQRCVVWF